MATTTKETSPVSQAQLETLKFVLRYALLIGVPVAIKYAANLQGFWGTLVGAVIPVLLPIIDKFVHEDPRISANGVVPF